MLFVLSLAVGRYEIAKGMASLPVMAAAGRIPVLNKNTMQVNAETKMPLISQRHLAVVE